MARHVEIGTKLCKADAPGYTLEVVEFIALDQGPPHARTRVRLMNHDLGERLYSVSALNDQRLFIAVTK
jgi:hypothetical protein